MKLKARVRGGGGGPGKHSQMSLYGGLVKGVSIRALTFENLCDHCGSEQVCADSGGDSEDGSAPGAFFAGFRAGVLKNSEMYSFLCRCMANTPGH